MRGAPNRTHCKHGHEIAVVGRYPNGQCRACVLRNDNPPVYTPGRPGRRPVARIKKPMPVGRPRMETCANGHDLNETRYKWRGVVKGCIACRALRNRIRPRRRGGRTERPTVPAGPIWAYVDKVGVRAFAQQAAISLGIKPASVERLIWRGRAKGFTVGTADDLCVAIGLHPVEVFGDIWFTYGTEEVASAV